LSILRRRSAPIKKAGISPGLFSQQLILSNQVT